MYRILHIEDLPFKEGFSGILKLHRCLIEMRNIIYGKPNDNWNLSIKYDGSPSIVCGRLWYHTPEEPDFFVGTKSVFNKVPKINFTNEEIDINHPELGLNKILKECLKYLPQLHFEGTIQGDLLYTWEELEIWDDYVSFKPNTIRYVVPRNCQLTENILNSNIGVIWHTHYPNNLNEAEYKIPLIESTKNVWCRDASITIPGNILTEEKQEYFESSLDNIFNLLEKCPMELLNTFSVNKKIREIMENYINDCVRNDFFPNIKGLEGNLEQYISSRISDAKKIETIKNRINEGNDLRSFFQKHIENISYLFDAWININSLKEFFIESLDEIDTGFMTFLEEGNKLKSTTNEGFVLTNSVTNDIVKIVNRYEFSQANFNNME